VPNLGLARTRSARRCQIWDQTRLHSQKIDVLLTPECVYIPLGYEKQVLPKGWQKTAENKPLDVDIIFEKDVKIVLRDGVTAFPPSTSMSNSSSDLYRYLPRASERGLPEGGFR